MKALILTLAISVSGFALANSGLGEADLKDCECKTCLIENGKCLRTQTNGDRYVPDKSSSSQSKSKSKGGSKAVSQ
ncbi:MAG TPA: hypothetical protein VKY27_09480 [Bacteriovoracaceae bacterium]|nr:hypothetical protein [Bacteriovoracaceae bacterium]